MYILILIALIFLWLALTSEHGKSFGRAIVKFFRSSFKGENTEGVNTTSVGALSIGIVIVIVAVLGIMCTNKIMPGYAGVVYNMDGGVEENVLPQGYHVVAPWKSVISYPISTETVYYTKSRDGKDKSDRYDNSINVNTKDGKQVNVSVTYAFHMDPENLPAVFTKFRGQSTQVIEAGYVKNEMYQAINEVTSQYSLMELVGDKRPEINAKVFEKFHSSLLPFGIIIETFNLSDVVPDEQTKEAIQKVVNAQNVLEQAKIEKQTAEVEAEKARIEARGKADAAIIEAEGQAKANEKLQQSLTQNVIQQHAIDKWNGELPKYQLGDKANALINIQ